MSKKKIFNDLCVGDKIYELKTGGRMLPSNDSSGNTYSPDIICVNSVSDLRDEKGNLCVNRNSYSSNYLLMLTPEDRGRAVLSRDRVTWFINKEEADDHIREAVLEKIRSNERYIVDTRARMLAENESLRKEYWHLLNFQPADKSVTE